MVLFINKDYNWILNQLNTKFQNKLQFRTIGPKLFEVEFLLQGTFVSI